MISGSTDRLLKTVSVGGGPFGVTYDPLNNDVYVANEVGNTVSVISAETNTVIATVNVGNATGPFGIGGAGPVFVALDPANGDLYVANSGASVVSVISGTTNRLVANIQVGTSPLDILYDPSNGDMYVGNYNFGNVSLSVISGSNNKVLHYIQLGSVVQSFTGLARFPQGLGYDPCNGNIYALNSYTNATYVVSSSSNSVIATIPVAAGPSGLIFDSHDGDVYVIGTQSVTVISGTTVSDTITTSGYPAALAFDPSNNQVYVAGSDAVYVLS